MILVTGAGGKTGQAILRQLDRRGAKARALVHNPAGVDAVLQAGAREALTGDFLSEADLNAAMQGVEALYHICPNMHPEEVRIGRAVLQAAKRAGVSHFVYHSVLHPQVSRMPHHWNKMLVEEMIFESGLPFTILQPCAYMQNMLGYWKRIVADGVYALPYPVETRISVVDLEDVAEAAAQVLTTPGHQAAIYELAGPQALSQAETAVLLAEALRREVRTEQIDRSAWERQVRAAGMADYAVNTLLAMFAYYEHFGFEGNPNALARLLGRPAHTLTQFIQRVIAGG